MTLRRKEGLIFGVIVWNHGLTAVGVLPAVPAAYRQGWIGGGWAVRLEVGAIFVVPPLIHAFSWRLWIGTCYGLLPLAAAVTRPAARRLIRCGARPFG